MAKYIAAVLAAFVVASVFLCLWELRLAIYPPDPGDDIASFPLTMAAAFLACFGFVLSVTTGIVSGLLWRKYCEPRSGDDVHA